MVYTAIKTPGVYVNEVSIFPPSVAQVPTAIPAFIGYTEKAEETTGDSLFMKPKKISSMVEFVLYFGNGPALSFDKTTGNGVELGASNEVVKAVNKQKYFLHDSVQLFYANGGGDCYILAVAKYDKISGSVDLGTIVPLAGMQGGVEVLKEVDEPTMIVFPDAVSMPNQDMYLLQQQALQQCNDLMDRVGVFDIKKAETKTELLTAVKEFRDYIGMNNLKYGAVYAPWLKVGIKKDVHYSDIKDQIVMTGTNAAIDLKTLVKNLSNDDTTKINAQIDSLNHVINDNILIASKIGAYLVFNPLYMPTGTGNLVSLSQSFDVLLQSVNNKIAAGEVAVNDTAAAAAASVAAMATAGTAATAATAAANTAAGSGAAADDATLGGHATDAATDTTNVVTAVNAVIAAVTLLNTAAADAAATTAETAATAAEIAASAAQDAITGASTGNDHTAVTDALAAASAARTAAIAARIASNPNNAALNTAANEIVKMIRQIYNLLMLIDDFGFNGASYMSNQKMWENTRNIIFSPVPSVFPANSTGTFNSELTELVKWDGTFSNINLNLKAISHTPLAPLQTGIPLSQMDFQTFNLPAPAVDTTLLSAPAPGNDDGLRIANQKAAIPKLKDLFNYFNNIITSVQTFGAALEKTTEDELKRAWPVYKSIIDGVNNNLTILPPSGAMAGIYARVDNERGVWKAPANVSVTYATGTLVNITDNIQDGLNVDVDAGKSVNAIRVFSGKGTMVWGARTLAGNDNEWRYVPVRRFFNMVEESVKKSTSWAVFEPNDANTWVKVKSMIENYLTLLWRQGALAGAKPEEAFFVEVGLNKTMTFVDILEGRMIVKIGMAAVRPAEFIILEFSHKIQTS